MQCYIVGSYTQASTSRLFWFCFCNRGDDFRKQFGNLDEVRSLVRPSVNVMALTATASLRTRQLIMNKLHMDEKESAVVEKVPNKLNIKYFVRYPRDDITTELQDIVSDIKANGKDTHKSIIFCRTYPDYIEVATALVNALEDVDALYVDDGSGSTKMVCEIFSASTDEDVKDDILTSFTNPSGSCRVVVATIAFGMGLDAANIYRIIHWGPSESVEAYIQESGRGG